MTSVQDTQPTVGMLTATGMPARLQGPVDRGRVVASRYGLWHPRRVLHAFYPPTRIARTTATENSVRQSRASEAQAWLASGATVQDRFRCQARGDTVPTESHPRQLTHDRRRSLGPSVATRWAWGICWLMFASTILNYMDRQTISLVKGEISREFHLETNAGFWLGARGVRHDLRAVSGGRGSPSRPVGLCGCPTRALWHGGHWRRWRRPPRRASACSLCFVACWG